MSKAKLIDLSEEQLLRARISAEFERLFPSNKGLASDIDRLLEIKALLAERNALHEEFDQIVLRLAAGGFEAVELAGERVSLVDNFKEKNTAWTSAAVKRYDLKVESLEKIAKREARTTKKGGVE